jgi:hypothetical protein
MAHNVAPRLGDRIRRLTGGSSREQHQPREEAADAGKASADSGPLGPEDQENPDRHAQHGGTPAGYERIPRTDPTKGRSDLEGGAWRTEATFDDEVPGHMCSAQSRSSGMAFSSSSRRTGYGTA